MAELATDPLAVGRAALAAGDWAVARAAFEAALDGDDAPAARDGLARALWWIEGPAPAIAERTHAYTGYRHCGDDRAAAHVALWIAHEYQVGIGNPAAAGGWLTRAAGLLEQLPEDADHARLELVRGERAGDLLQAGHHAKAALEIARRLGDPDLEITALGRLGRAEVRVGAVESGMSRMDEAMAAGLGGEATELETLGELCCDLIAACDQTGDVDRLRKQTASTTETAPGYEGPFEDLGGYTVAFETYTEDADMAPLFAGLPDDRCQCPHWGVVLKGKVTYHYGDSSETIETGEAYFAPPGHTPELHAGTELVEFSPTAELERTLAVVFRNVESAQTQA